MLTKKEAIDTFNEVYNNVCKTLDWKYEKENQWNETPRAEYVIHFKDNKLMFMTLNIYNKHYPTDGSDEWYLSLQYYNDVHSYQNFKPTIFLKKEEYKLGTTEEIQKIKENILNSHKYLKQYFNELKKYQIRQEFK